MKLCKEGIRFYSNYLTSYSYDNYDIAIGVTGRTLDEIEDRISFYIYGVSLGRGAPLHAMRILEHLRRVE